MLNFEIREIDAVFRENVWSWDQTIYLGEVSFKKEDLTPRKIFRFLRSAGFLSEESKGEVFLDDDWLLLEVYDRKTRKPLIVLIPKEEI